MKQQPVRAQPRAVLWIHAVLFVAVFLVYAQAAQFDFVNFDDPDYVTANFHVRAGITAAGIGWAFTSTEAANWFPVTRLSEMLDVQLFGLRSGWHHLENVLWHAVATLLLFAFLNRATHARWPSAFVALVFAVHPLHVESVAWIAERKDVLSALFSFLTLWAYVRYTERPSASRYVLTVVAFALGLMSKPMIVTLPFVMLLLDFWPLRRLQRSAIWEKAPFFILSAVVSIATYTVQKGSGAVQAFDIHPLGMRIANAIVSYAIYIGKTFWPGKLAVFYPYPSNLPAWQVLVCALVLAGVSAGAGLTWRRHPYISVGWLWFLGTLLPVIGLIQVGAQARADRYMYVPMVGLSILVAWGAADVLQRWPQMKTSAAALAGLACVALAMVSGVQASYWNNSELLFEHVLAVTHDNYVAEHNLGSALLDDTGRLPDAIDHLRTALRIEPNSAKAHTDLASALARIPGDSSQAVAEYQQALRLAPDAAIPHNNMGNMLSKIPGRLPEAIAQYRIALRLNTNYPEAHNNLGSALLRSGKIAEAIAEFEAALRINPDYPEAHNNLGSALSAIPGRLGEAVSEYETALRLRPDYAEAENNLGSALSEIPGRLPEAIRHYQAALNREPEYPEAHYNLGLALSRTQGNSAEAIAQFEEALRLRPQYPEAHNNLGVALANAPGRAAEAIAHFQAAVQQKPDYADAHYNLGVSLSEIPGRFPEALAHLETALRLRPDPQLQRTVEQFRRTRR